MENVKLYNENCLEKLINLEDKSIDLVLIDPPYNIGKASWDKWETIDKYVDFMGKIFLEIQRVLKDNGSFYFFHNDFLQMAELQHWINKNTKFIFKSLITWDKLTNADTVQIGSLAKGYGNLRNYFSGSTCEYCVFYTMTDENMESNYKKCREYSKKILEYIGKNKKSIIEEIGQRADHFFRIDSSQWGFPTKETYELIVDKYNVNEMEGFLDYEQFNILFENERYTYNKPQIKIIDTKLDELKNNLRGVTTIWDFDRPKSNYKLGHITPKPVKLLEHIINISSNVGDIVLDCFMGSGSTGVACISTNRKFIGIELDNTYYEVAKNRINEALTIKGSTRCL